MGLFLKNWGGGNIGGMGKKIFEISMMMMEITDAQLWNELCIFRMGKRLLIRFLH